MFLPLIILSVLTISFALPNGINPQNVITVPPNCPPGQELINGQCRDIWRSGLTTPLPPSLIYGINNSPTNMVTVPPNCPPGQQLINGQCRDVWKGVLAESRLFEMLLKKTLARSTNSEFSRREEHENGNENLLESNDSLRNIISVPTQCPEGYRPDALGICRRIF
ncbi:uncharacterized protein LOC126770150 isoform X2 [Nymphalis io]|uniref:uncharacterized protein LOC126770150 isoform X2 n=1 Tax=Inachis io TaxID=171585 RepID=UPI002167114A|nr:uncharacterized protein LOC126770150 isoform X2 [Nymphalis io]